MSHFSDLRQLRQLPEWLAKDPRARKWIVACVACGTMGYRADAPDEFFDRYWLEKLGPLPLNDVGMCEVCARATSAGHDES